MKHLYSTDVGSMGARRRAARQLSRGAVLCSCLLAWTASAQTAAPANAANEADAASASNAASAAAPSSDAPSASAGSSRADALIEQGMQLRRAGKDEAALAAFEEATTLDPESTRARVHLAAAHQALGHWVEADALLAELLQRSDDPYIQRHHTTLLRAQEFVGRHLGTLLLAGQPAGALVTVDGRELGSLPLAKPVRLPVGSYQLEVRQPGHYPLRRTVTITAGSTLREEVELAPLQAAAPAPVESSGAEATFGVPRWLAWTLTGLAAGGAVATGVAWGVRNRHAERWNSDACLAPGRARGEVCPGERDDGKRAETLAYVSGAATVLLAAGAAVSWTLLEVPLAEAPSGAEAVAPRAVSSEAVASEAVSSEAVALRCGLSFGLAACSGSF